MCNLIFSFRPVNINSIKWLVTSKLKEEVQENMGCQRVGINVSTQESLDTIIWLAKKLLKHSCGEESGCGELPVMF